MAGFETSKFGNGLTSLSAGGNVVVAQGTPHNYFGPRDSGGTVGVLHVDGIVEELIIDFTGQQFNDGITPALVPYILPAGAVIKDVFLYVSTVFVATTDTTFGLEIGTSSTEATNGFTTTKAQLESTGYTNLTSALSGTWDAEVPLAAATTIKAVLSGTNSAITDAGEARFTIVYVRTKQ